MYFEENNGCFTARQQNEKILIEAWGNNALRVRVTHNSDFNNDDKALSPVKSSVEITLEDSRAVIKNGKISCIISKSGGLKFFKEGNSILKEYARDWRNLNGHSPSMKFFAREFKPVSGNDYSITARFEAQDREKIYGMGQYQQPELDLKGCVLELAQRNSQISVPFCISNKG